jgi:hypothetical protein
MTAHRWFSNTSCPGDYLYNKFGEIADAVNEKLGVKKPVITVSGSDSIKVSGEGSIKVSGENDLKVEELKVGSIVKILPKATWSSGANVPDWVLKSKLYLRQIRKDGLYVVSTKQTGPITGVIAPKYVIAYSAPIPQEFVAYLVRITADALNVRAGASTKYKINTQVKKNQIYTIVDEKDGWGKLKSGAGWISLIYTEKVK